MFAASEPAEPAPPAEHPAARSTAIEIFYSGTDSLSGSGNCEQTAYTDRKWICDHDSDYLLVFRNYPVYTGQSAQAGF